MNYELAKQLKDAKFPKDIYSVGDRYYTDNKSQSWTLISEQLGKDQFNKTKTYVYIPTLSELIEAVATFENTQFCLYGRSQDRWEATEVGMSINDPSQTMKSKSFTYIGSTPEEAVAKLWLELNKK